MSHLLYGADRSTHVKIVVVGFLCAVVVGAVGTYARVGDEDATAQFVKAGQPTATGGLPVIR